jgi:hypothetical protein
LRFVTAILTATLKGGVKVTEQEIKAVSDSLAQKYVLITRTRFLAFLGGFLAFLAAAGFLTYQNVLSAVSATGAESAVNQIKQFREQAQSGAASINELLESFSNLPTSVLSAQVSGAPETQANQFVNIPGLSLELPPGNSIRKFALVALNVPSPYAVGDNFPGAEFAVAVNGQVVGTGNFTYESRKPQSFSRHPFTLIVCVKLATDTPTQVTAQWRSVRNASCRIDSFASISAVLG